MTEPSEAPPRPPQKVGVREFRGNFSGFMRQVRHGASFAVTSRDEARAARDAGADVLVAQGAEAGGHRGSWTDADGPDLPVLELLAALRDAVTPGEFDDITSQLDRSYRELLPEGAAVGR